MEAAVPGEVIDACGGFEKDNRGACRGRRLAGHSLRNPGNPAVIESADKSALDALVEEFSKSIHERLIFDLYSAIIRYQIMNRIDRLFAILLTLQHRRRIRARDLADQFEVSKRTIYRDLSALNQMGVPLAALPGEGFELVEGYYIPPLMFTESEAVALILGSRLLTQQAAGSLTRDADQALAKITIALPEQVRARAQAMTSIIGFITPSKKFNLDEPQLLVLQKAIQEKRVVHIRYLGYQRDQVTERDVEPHQLFYSDGIWYLEGYCRWRQDIRAFRLSRIEKLSLRNETFSKLQKGKPKNARTIDVKIRFKVDTVRWVRERQHYGFQDEEPAAQKGITMNYRVHDLSEITPWILSWGVAAEVLSPQQLRESLRETAQKLADLLT